MSIAKEFARHLREIHFGGNWSEVNFKDTLADVSWQQATTKVYDFNSIAMLTCHSSYFVTRLLNGLKGGPVISDQAASFMHPLIQSEHDWEQLLEKTRVDGEEAAKLIELLPDHKLTEIFDERNQASYFRYISGTIEHMHYHLGQIVLIKKILSQAD